MTLRATTERPWSARSPENAQTELQNREGLTSGHLACSTPHAVPANTPPWIEHALEASRNMHSTQDSHIPRSEDSGVRRRRTVAAMRRAAQLPRRAAQVALRKSQMSSDSERLPRRAHPQPDAAVAASVEQRSRCVVAAHRPRATQVAPPRARLSLLSAAQRPYRAARPPRAAQVAPR